MLNLCELSWGPESHLSKIVRKKCISKDELACSQLASVVHVGFAYAIAARAAASAEVQVTMTAS
jgi:hypothetical protein